MNKFIVSHALITEKAAQLGEFNKYLFLVSGKANKPEIKKAIEAIYKVQAIRVNIVNVKSKERRLGRSVGVKSGYKKAIVTLKKGQKLDILPR